MSVQDLIDRIEMAKSNLQGAKNQVSKDGQGDIDIIKHQHTDSRWDSSLDFSRSEEALTRMHQEMIGNLDDIDKMQFWNSIGAISLGFASIGAVPLGLASIGAKLPALAEFAYRVRSGGEWDHKPMLRDELGLNPDGQSRTRDEDWYFPIEGNNQDEYNYDIWSNIHYGYIGRAAGFTPFELTNAASVADGFNHIPADDLSVRIGMELWEEHGSNLTEEQLRQAIIDHTDEYKQVQNEENVAVITPEDERWNGS